MKFSNNHLDLWVALMRCDFNYVELRDKNKETIAIMDCTETPRINTAFYHLPVKLEFLDYWKDNKYVNARITFLENDIASLEEIKNKRS